MCLRDALSCSALCSARGQRLDFWRVRGGGGSPFFFDALPPLGRTQNDLRQADAETFCSFLVGCSI